MSQVDALKELEKRDSRPRGDAQGNRGPRGPRGPRGQGGFGGRSQRSGDRERGPRRAWDR